MRAVLFMGLAFVFATNAWAEDLRVPAPITEAVIYLQGAKLTRRAAVQIPAGSHRLLVPVSAENGLPQVTLEDVPIAGVEILPSAGLDGRAFLTPAQAAAHTAWLTAVEGTQQAEDARIRVAADLASANDQLAFLRSVGGTALTSLDPTTLAATAEAIGSAVAEAEVSRANARAALRGAEQAARDAALLEAQAKRDLDATGAQLGAVTLLAIDVSVAEARDAELTLTSFSRQAGWQPSYDVTLTAEQGIRMARKVEVFQTTGLPLSDISLTLSTADPFARPAPSPVEPDLARIAPPQTRGDVRLSGAADIAIAEAVSPAARGQFAQDVDIVFQANFDGPVVTYVYPRPVTVPSQNGRVILTLDSFDLQARVFNRAAPRHDQTAYLMAEVVNTSGEPVLAGTATLYREDTRIGQTELQFLASGDEMELAFGPLQHLPLEFRFLENETGDRGLFVTSGTRRQDMVFRVRNLSDNAETVEARFPLPFSEQEDLDVSVRATPEPDERDIDDRRGVSQWSLNVPPGGKADVTISVDMEWPEDQVLSWRP